MVRLRAYAPMGDFTGGLNEDPRIGGLAVNEMRVARNVFWTGRNLASRPALTRIQSSALNSGATCSGIHYHTYGATPTNKVVAIFGSKFYEDADNASPTDRTGAITITANTGVTFTSFNDELVMVTGAGDAPFKWTGAGNNLAALGGSPPSFKTMAAKWNRVFGAGHAAAIRTIRYSGLGTHETWNAADTVSSTLDDANPSIEGADEVLQLSHLGDSLFVGLRETIGRVLYTGDLATPFKYDTIANFGVCSRWSYVPYGTGGYFLSPRGVHYVRATDALITYESSFVRTPAHVQSVFAASNFSLADVQGVRVNLAGGNSYIIWASVGVNPESAFPYQMLIMRVTDGPGKEAFALWNSTPAEPRRVATGPIGASAGVALYTGSTNGFVWKLGNAPAAADVGAATTAFTSTFASRWEDFGKPGERKNLRDVFVQGDFDTHTTTAPTLDVYYDRDPNVGYQPSLLTNVPSQHVLGVDDGTVLSFGISAADVSAAWTLDRLVPAVESSGEYDDADTGG